MSRRPGQAEQDRAAVASCDSGQDTHGAVDRLLLDDPRNPSDERHVAFPGDASPGTAKRAGKVGRLLLQRPGSRLSLRPRHRVHEPPGISPQHVIVRPPCWWGSGHFQRFDLRGDLSAYASWSVANNLVWKDMVRLGLQRWNNRARRSSRRQRRFYIFNIVVQQFGTPCKNRGGLRAL